MKAGKKTSQKFQIMETTIFEQFSNYFFKLTNCSSHGRERKKKKKKKQQVLRYGKEFVKNLN